jgi:hypothetical protein
MHRKSFAILFSIKFIAVFMALLWAQTVMADDANDVAIYLAKRFRVSYIQELQEKGGHTGELQVAQSTDFLKYCIDKFKKLFTSYLSSGDIRRILRSHKFTNEEKAMIDEIESGIRLDVAVARVKNALENLR